MTPSQITRRRQEIQLMAALRSELDTAINNGNASIEHERQHQHGSGIIKSSGRDHDSAQKEYTRAYMNGAWFAGERAFEFLTLLATVDDPACGKVKERLGQLQRQIATVQAGATETERRAVKATKDKARAG